MKITQPITVGYNLDKQNFFDALRIYKRHILEYYFSLTHTVEQYPLDMKAVANDLSRCDQYGIAANLLLNNFQTYHNWNEQIHIAKNICNLRSVTVLNKAIALAIKEKHPNLKIHYSTHASTELSLNDLDKDLIEAFNVNEPWKNEFIKLTEAAHQAGILIKYICNRGCIINKSSTINDLIGSNMNCCGQRCKTFFKKYPYLQLMSCDIYKESLQYMNVDIVKISCRSTKTAIIRNMLDYWTNKNNTAFIGTMHFRKERYQYFLEWCKIKATCNGECAKCKKCISMYHNIFT